MRVMREGQTIDRAVRPAKACGGPPCKTLNDPETVAGVRHLCNKRPQLCVILTACIVHSEPRESCGSEYLTPLYFLLSLFGSSIC